MQQNSRQKLLSRHWGFRINWSFAIFYNTSSPYLPPVMVIAQTHPQSPWKLIILLQNNSIYLAQTSKWWLGWSRFPPPSPFPAAAQVSSPPLPTPCPAFSVIDFLLLLLQTRNLGARWAPICSWWPSATLLALRAYLTSSFTPFGHSSRVLLHVKGGG